MTNFLIIMADEHSRHICGCYGNQVVQTPNIDKLAARGTRFDNGYSSSPICVPARAAFATGQPVHRTGHWDNSFAYAGEPASWAHVIRDAGRDVVSIGKLHYRSSDDDLGFDESIEPIYLHNGTGDILGCVREPLPIRWVTRNMAEKIGPGETDYTAYDRRVTKAAVDWLAHRRPDGNPWTAYVSLVAPHFPLIAPLEFYERYADLDLMPTKSVPENEHPWLQAFRNCYIYDNFTEEKTRVALASYYALTTFMDDNVGQVLNALDAAGLAEDTVVLYLSDHGDNAGERGLWGKSVMYEESVGIPMVLAGPGVPVGKVSTTPATLTDVYATALDVAGLACDAPSLRGIAASDDDPERVGFSEYHAAGSPSAAYMIRKGRWKYIHYVDFPPQLFDIEADPDELFDLGISEKHSEIRSELVTCLADICDPDEMDRRAKAEQRQKVESFGGREAVVEKGSFGATPIPAT